MSGVSGDVDKNCCAHCRDVWRSTLDDGDPHTPLRRIVGRMLVCPECGNKRCPKATHHAWQCTKSNEPGQPGSAHK